MVTKLRLLSRSRISGTWQTVVAICTKLIRILVFWEDSSSVGQGGVSESPITSHVSPITLAAACRAVLKQFDP
jgi:hypothetical protein